MGCHCSARKPIVGMNYLIEALKKDQYPISVLYAL